MVLYISLKAHNHELICLKQALRCFFKTRGGINKEGCGGQRDTKNKCNKQKRQIDSNPTLSNNYFSG